MFEEIDRILSRIRFVETQLILSNNHEVKENLTIQLIKMQKQLNQLKNPPTY